MSKLKVEVEDGIGLITLVDPERRNAIDLEMADGLVAAVAELEADADVGAVVVTGAGSSFCAGASLQSIQAGDRDAFERIYEAFMCVARCSLPAVAAVNGSAVGAGLNLALACDVRLVSGDARLISRFVELGLHPGGGHTWMLSRIGGTQLAAAMVLFGEELRGEEAVRAGLALRCVASERLVEDALELARRAAAPPRDLVVRAKATLRAMGAIDEHAAALDLEREAQVWSTSQPFYGERVSALRRRIGGGSAPG